ncbi:ATP-binding protein [Desulfopila sp. IMCC35008]|uniref:ATP-binding protein n=1 Tax=Desulfopila sp. IMCC35008 TaxID=2653858 RepID=UPI0013D069C7|nr:ATP-binding protein [Desulfopila sp. IMCC35008]
MKDESAKSNQQGKEQLLKRVAWLERKIERLQESQLRREKLDDINRHLLNNALTELESAREKSEAASKAKTEFLTNMSHEIRTPLNIIMGLGELLEETELDERQQQFVRNLRGAGRHLLEIIDSILEFSRIEKGDVELVVRPFNLRRLIQNLTDMLQTLATKKGLRFKLEWEGDVGQIYQGDKGKIKQVLLNLLGNAIKFTEKGQVKLLVRQEQGAGGLVFQISDTGIGISDKERSAVFERFSQARTTLSRKQGGVGLGLAIVRILVEAMGGSISMDSRVGQGTVFTLHIPLVTTPDGADMTSGTLLGKPLPDLSDLRLLVVDDMAGNREVVQYYLEGLPLHAEYADSGRGAIEKCMRHGFDLILLDISMPEVDGITAIREIREIERQKGTPPSRIVAMTAHAFQEIKESLLDEGFDEILTKPFSRTDLLVVLAGVINEVPVAGLEREVVVSPADVSWQDVEVPDSLVTLIPKFLEIMLCEHEKIGEVIRSVNYLSIVELSHANKGVAGMYGFTPVMKMFAALEQAGTERDHLRCCEMWDDLASVISDLADTCPVTDM